MTRAEKVEYLRRVVDSTKGDDLERAQMAFRGMSFSQMQESFGQSGLTRQQVLDSYWAERQRVAEVLDFINTL